MKRSAKDLFVIILILTSLIVSGIRVTPAYAQSSMQLVFLPLPSGWNSGNLNGVWGSSANDVYAVGYGYNGSANMPLLYRWNGSSWTASSPSLPPGWSSGYLYSVWGSSANDVYAVGSGNSVNLPLLYHWNGSSWTASSPSLPAGFSRGNLNGVWGSSANDVYAVGSGLNGSTIVPLLYRWNGSSWTASSPSLPAGLSSGNLYGVWGSSANNVYAVGDGNNGVPLLYRWNGSSWTASSPSLPAGFSSANLRAVWGFSASDVYAVGNGYNGSTTVPLLYRWNGSSWTASSLSLPAGQSAGYSYGVWGSANSDMYAVGSSSAGGGLIPLQYYKDASNWTASSPSLPPDWSSGYLNGVWGSSATDVYAVGTSNNGSDNMPLLYHSGQGGPDLFPPGKASLVSPTGTVGTNNPTYTWNAVSSATWYYLWVNGPSGNVFKQWYSAAQANCSSTCSIANATPGLRAGSHTWWVQTWNDAGYGPWSDGMTFTPPTLTLPGKATLGSPTGTIGTNNPTYTWNAVSNATWYYLWVNGPSGNVIKTWYTVAQANCSSTCSVTPSTSLSGGAHTWWIQTYNSLGYGPWSDGMTFTPPTPTLPGKATLVSPTGTIGTNNPTYTWNEVSGATWYYLWVNGPSGNVIKTWYQASTSCSGGTCSVTNTSLGSGAHSWWVQTWNNVGYGPWSDAMNFSVP